MPKLVFYPLVVSFASLIFLDLSGDSTRRYVATNGSNTNPGTELLPWETIQYAVDNVDPGQTIYVRGGTYREKITFSGSSDSGSSTGGYVTLQNYPGEKATISGEGLMPIDREGLMSIVDAHHVKIIGFELKDFDTADAGRTPVGVYVEGASNHIELRKNRIHHIETHNTEEGGAHGIGIFGTNAGAAITDLIIDGNEIMDCVLLWSEALVLNGNVKGFTVSNNSVHDCNNIAYDFIGFERECEECGSRGTNLDQARDGIVLNNVAYNIDTKDNPVYENERSAAGFYVDGGRNIMFEANIAHDCNLGFELASEHKGKGTAGIILRNNLAYNNHILGISTGGYKASAGKAKDCYVVNNTFYKNHNSNRSKDNWGAEIVLQNNNTNNVYKNNIVYAKHGEARVLIDGSGNSNNLFDYNNYFGSSEGSTPGSNSLFSNPLFIAPDKGDFRIAADSPAIDAGQNLAVSVIGTVDLYGNPRIHNGRVDIGASEYGSRAGIIGVD